MSIPESRPEETPASSDAAQEPGAAAQPSVTPGPSDLVTPAASDASDASDTAAQEPGAAAQEPLPGVMPEAIRDLFKVPGSAHAGATDVASDGNAADATPYAGATDVALDGSAADVVPDAMPDAVPDAAVAGGPGGRDDLRAAVGLPERSEGAGAPPRGPRRRIALFLGATALLGAIVAGVAFLGWQNQQRYYLVCGEDDIAAAQGRSFPPWGRSALEGKAWQAIPRPLEAPCEERVFDSREGLARSFAETLVTRVDAWVIARAQGAGREHLAAAQAQLDQALRVLRELRQPGSEPAELSGKIQRLRGDLDYWQARDRIDTALAELAKAAQHLDSAVAHDPHHHHEDALAWQRALARLQAELGAVARTAAPDAAAATGQPETAAGATTGTALPAAPGMDAQPGTSDQPVSLDGGLAPGPGSTSDAGPTQAPPSVPGVPGGAVPEAPQPPPDAGPSRGGLLI